MGVKKVVLTGGPCAGKTKILEFLRKELTKSGYYVIVVSETASEYIRNNVLPKSDREHTLMFQDLILCTQYVKERSTEIYADFIKNTNDVVILYDRALMDNRAYFSQEDYDNLLRKYDINEMEMVDKYDLVIDLISTASLKPDSYELNDTRSEAIEDASRIDTLTSLAWLLHRNLKVIKPTDELEEKAHIVLDLILELLNNKQKINTVVKEIDIEKSNLSEFNENNSKRININKVWLDKESYNGYEYVLSWKHYNYQTSYTCDVICDDILIESKPITKEEYMSMLSLYQIKYMESVEQINFVKDGNYFQIINKEGKSYIQTESNNLAHLPSNIKLEESKCKNLTKTRNML